MSDLRLTEIGSSREMEMDKPKNAFSKAFEMMHRNGTDEQTITAYEAILKAAYRHHLGEIYLDGHFLCVDDPTIKESRKPD